MLKWNYISNIEKSTGYEDVLDTLKFYTKEMYNQATDEEKERIINEIFQIYRNKNIYPITYYNNEGIYKEIQKCIDKHSKLIENNVLPIGSNEGTLLCKFLNPNFIYVTNKSDKRSFYHKFYNDEILKRAIKTSIKHKKDVSPGILRDTLNIVSGATYSNFKPMIAKTIYEKYCPKNGIIYDFSCGWGGRMLGALSSKNNYTYIGVEPCIETYTHLNELGLHIEHVTGRKNSYKLFCMGSEDFMIKENCIDFAFSSPPYFNLEKYSDEPTQCYNKFPTLDEWFEGYVKPTIENTYKMLKPNTYYAVNIADFKIGKQEIKFVDKWIELAKEIGFTYTEQIYMKLPLRCGDGHDKAINKIQSKKEGIFVFLKTKN